MGPGGAGRRLKHADYTRGPDHWPQWASNQLERAPDHWPLRHASRCYSSRAVVVVLARRRLLDPWFGGKQAALLLRIDADRRLPGQRANSVQHVLRSDPGVLVARCS